MSAYVCAFARYAAQPLQLSAHETDCKRNKNMRASDARLLEYRAPRYGRMQSTTIGAELHTRHLLPVLLYRSAVRYCVWIEYTHRRLLSSQTYRPRHTTEAASALLVLVQ